MIHRQDGKWTVSFLFYDLDVSCEMSHRIGGVIQRNDDKQSSNLFGRYFAWISPGTGPITVQ